jgi:hypothetical protein
MDSSVDKHSQETVTKSVMEVKYPMIVLVFMFNLSLLPTVWLRNLRVLPDRPQRRRGTRLCQPKTEFFMCSKFSIYPQPACFLSRCCHTLLIFSYHFY